MRASAASTDAFSLLWWSFVVTSAGSGAAAGVLALIAITVLHAPASAVTVMSAAGIVSGSVAAPAASRALQRYEVRRVVAATEAVQAVALAGLLVAASQGRLSLPLVTAVTAVETCGVLVYGAVVSLTVKQLTAAEHLVRRAGRLEAVTWTAQGLGPVLGGLLVSVAGWQATVVVDAASFLVSAALVSGLRLPDPRSDTDAGPS